MVFMGSIYTFTKNTNFFIYVQGFQDKSSNILNVLTGQRVRVADKIYEIHAQLHCGSQEEAIYIQICEQGSLINFVPS